MLQKVWVVQYKECMQPALNLTMGNNHEQRRAGARKFEDFICSFIERRARDGLLFVHLFDRTLFMNITRGKAV